jgi:DNA-binding MarR family transcriptional regulator
MLITLTTLSDALAAFKDFTGDGYVQIQTIQTFLKVARNEGTAVSFEDIVKATGVTRGAVSRNLKKLATGPRVQEGYGLITVELDPYDSRRRIIKLSGRGHELIQFIEGRTLPRLRHHFIQELVVNQHEYQSKGKETDILV